MGKIFYSFLITFYKTITELNFIVERSRQSARECRARKKLRYQYLEELVADREKAVLALRAELERVSQYKTILNPNISCYSLEIEVCVCNKYIF